MHIKRRQDINWLDLPKIESPTFAKSWIEQNINVNVNLNGFGVQWVRGLSDVLGSDLEPLRGGKALDCHSRARLLEKIERCEVFLVHELGSEPFVPVVRPGQGNNTWLVDNSLSLDAQFNVECTISNAIQTKGSLAPPPPKPKTEPAAQASKKEEKPATGGIALLPVRYAIGKRSEGDSQYGYTGDTLKQDFPELKHARYVLRTLRTGFVYVYYEDELECFSIGPNRLVPPKERNIPGIKVNGDALLFPSDEKEVILAFSEHEWTDQQRRKIIDNEEGCRDSQMQRFALDNLKQDTLPLADLATQVEEYAGVYDGQYKDWTEHPSHGGHEAGSRISKLKSRAGMGQHVVVLHDPVGITHELTNLLELTQKELQDYTAENLREKVIAETIEQLYVSHYLKGNFEGVDDLAKVRQEWYEANYPKLGRDIPSLDEIKQEIRKDALNSREAADLSEHVDEEKRKKVLTDFKHFVDITQEKLLELKKDRSSWLNTADSTAGPQMLGSAWATYDMADTPSWSEYEYCFARCISAMLAVPQPTEQVREDPEFKLLEQWVATPSSPLYQAIMGQTDLHDTVMNNPDRLGDIIDGSAKVIEQIYKHYPYNIATLEISNTLTAYSFTAKPDTSGKTRARVDKALRSALRERLQNLSNNNDEFLKALQTLAARHGLAVTTEVFEEETVLRKLEEATGREGIVEEYRSEIRKTGSLNKGGIAVWEVNDITERTTEQRLANYRPNPFAGLGNLGISGIVSFFNVQNVMFAADAIINDKNSASGEMAVENFTNFVSAIAGLGAAAAGTVEATNEILKRSATRLNIKGTPATERLARALNSRLATRLFGYGGAFFSGVTDGIEGFKQFRQGEFDAGLLYTMSGVTIFAGGSALTYGTLMLAINPFVGVVVIIVGLMLTGLSLLFKYGAENTVSGPVERWLDSGSFGRRERDDAVTYESLQEEQEGLITLLHEPVVLEPNFEIEVGFEHNLAEFRIFLPNYREKQYRLVDGALELVEEPSKFDLKDAMGRTVYPDDRKPTPSGLLLTYRDHIDKDEHDKWIMDYVAKYIPTEAFKDKPIVKRFSVEHLFHIRPDS